MLAPVTPSLPPCRASCVCCTSASPWPSWWSRWGAAVLPSVNWSVAGCAHACLMCLPAGGGVRACCVRPASAERASAMHHVAWPQLALTKPSVFLHSLCGRRAARRRRAPPAAWRCSPPPSMAGKQQRLREGMSGWVAAACAGAFAALAMAWRPTFLCPAAHQPAPCLLPRRAPIYLGSKEEVEEIERWGWGWGWGHVCLEGGVGRTQRGEDDETAC